MATLQIRPVDLVDTEGPSTPGVDPVDSLSVKLIGQLASLSLIPGKSRLESLPAELLDNIASFLPYTSSLALAWTSTTIFKKLDQSVLDWSPSSHLDTAFDLLILEKWPVFKHHFTCCFCHKLLPKDHFTLRQITLLFPKQKYHVQSMLEVQHALKIRESLGMSPICVTKARRPLVSQQTALSDEVAGRLCIHCGIREGRYHGGEELHFATDFSPDAPVAGTGYGTGIVCKICEIFKVCDADSRCGRQRICQDCLGETPGYHDKMFQYFDGAHQPRKLTA